MNTNGDTTWWKTYGGSDIEGATHILNTSDGNILVAGYHCIFEVDANIFLLKLN